MLQTLPQAATAVAIAWLTLVSSPSPTIAGGGHDHSHGPDIGGPASPAEADRTVEVVMRDNRYDPEALSIEPGATVRFEIRNAGALVHEFNLGTAEMHAAHRDEMQAMMREGTMTATSVEADAHAGHGHDEPNSVLLEPGERAVLVWTFPEDRPIDLQFACNVPGHYEAGMVGPVTLEGS